MPSQLPADDPLTLPGPEGPLPLRAQTERLPLCEPLASRVIGPVSDGRLRDSDGSDSDDSLSDDDFTDDDSYDDLALWGGSPLCSYA